MVYEMRTYTLKIGKTHEYLRHFEEIGLPLITKYAKLVGYWYTEIGELNQIIHIWAYENMEQRAQARKALYSDREWLEKFIPVAMTLLEKQENKILYPTNFSPIK